MTNQHMTDPAVGMMVHSADGAHLGTITEMRDNRFRLDTSDGEVHWLDRGDIATVEGNEARLSFEAESIREHEMTPGTESMLPTEDEQREVMLQQLAEQRQHIREAGIATPEADASIGEPVEEELSRRAHESASA